MEYSLFDLSLAFLATFLLGMSKSGVKGIGVIIVILMALVFGSRPSTGVLIPLMITADIIAVVYYHRHAQWKFLRKLMPMMIVGVLMGVWLGDRISEEAFKQVMAGFILVSVVAMIWMDRTKHITIPRHWSFSGSMGLLSGISSMIGNLAGSFASVYLLAMRLPKNAFIGTAAWLFFIINLFKLPFHIFVWRTVNKDSLKMDLILAPAIFLGFLVGVWVVRLFSNELYRKFILLVTAIGAIFILAN